MDKEYLMNLFKEATPYPVGVDFYETFVKESLQEQLKQYVTYEEEDGGYPLIDVVDWSEPFTIICESFNDRLITFSHIIRDEHRIHDKESVLWEMHDMEDYEEAPNIHWDGDDFFAWDDTNENPIPSWKFRGESKDKNLKFKFVG